MPAQDDVLGYFTGMLEHALDDEATPTPTLLRAVLAQMGTGIEAYAGFFRGIFREIMKISQEPVSLEMPIGEEEDSNLGDFIEDQKALPPADAASRQMLKEQLDGVLETLSERERAVLTMRYGLEDGRNKTLEEVGRELGITRESFSRALAVLQGFGIAVRGETILISDATRLAAECLPDPLIDGPESSSTPAARS